MSKEESILAEIKAKLDAAEADLRQAEENAKKLREQYERLQTAHQVIGEMLSSKERQAPKAAPPPPPQKPASRRPAPKSKPAVPLTVTARAIRELEKAGEFLSTQELLDKMLASGYKPQAKGSVYDAVYGTLDAVRRRNGPIVRDSGKWGLLDWQSAPKAMTA